MNKRSSNDIELPTEEKIISDQNHTRVQVLKKFCNELSSNLKAIQQKKELQKRKDAVATIEKLFMSYVSPLCPNKVFNENKVHLDPTDSYAKNKYYTYEYDHVSISYLGRITWIKDDLNYFIKINVLIDGKTIYSLDS